MRLINADEVIKEIKRNKLLAREPATERCMEIIKGATTYIEPPQETAGQMEKVELAPCPFCGGEVELNEDGFYMFCCNQCGAGVAFAEELEDGTATDMSEGASIRAWNRRVNNE